MKMIINCILVGKDNMKCVEYDPHSVLCMACSFPKDIKCCIYGDEYVSWCERTGNVIEPESYQEFLDQEDIEEHYIKI